MNGRTPDDIIKECLSMSDKGISVKKILEFHNTETGKKTSYGSFTSTLAKWRKKSLLNKKRLWLLPEEERKKHPRVVGIIGDTQHPFEHTRSLEIVIDTFIEWKVTVVVHIGDLIDNAAISDYESSDEAYNVNQETSLAKKHLAKWVEAFPSVKVCIGNHDMRYFKKLKKLGLKNEAKDIYRNKFGLPQTWELEKEFIIDNVKYKHRPLGGKFGFFNIAIFQLKSVVTGHAHSNFGIKYQSYDEGLHFGMGVGCLIDIDYYAFDYTEDAQNMPILGCGIVISENEAYPIPMAKKYLN